jgi:hypothetical protein
MEFLESVFNMNLRKLQQSLQGKYKGDWNSAGMHTIDIHLKDHT